MTVGPTAPNAVATARLWIVYRTGVAPSAIPTQTLTVHETGSGQTWQITVDANTVARQTAATALVLDRSGSMSEDRAEDARINDVRSIRRCRRWLDSLVRAGVWGG